MVLFAAGSTALSGAGAASGGTGRAAPLVFACRRVLHRVAGAPTAAATFAHEYECDAVAVFGGPTVCQRQHATVRPYDAAAVSASATPVAAAAAAAAATPVAAAAAPVAAAAAVAAATPSGVAVRSANAADRVHLLFSSRPVNQFLLLIPRFSFLIP